MWINVFLTFILYFSGAVEKVNFLYDTPKSHSLAPPERLREGEGGTY
jgi:hypothetical protein